MIRRMTTMPGRGPLGWARGWLVLLGCVGVAAAQGPPPAPPIGGFPPNPGRPFLGTDPNAPPAANLVGNLVGTTGVFEVKLGQGRFLALDPGAGSGPPPQGAAPPRVLAVGDPSVADFFQINPGQLRVVGKKLGTTDLMVTNRDGRTFEFEVRVVADLDVLRDQLRALFPDASLKLAQFREKIVVEGEARDANQVGRIINTIETYARSTQRVVIGGQIGNFQATDAQGPGAAPADPNAPAAAPNGDPAAAAMAAAMGGNPAGAAMGTNPMAASTAPFQAVQGIGGGLPSSSSAGSSSEPTAGEVTLGKYVTGSFQVVNLIRVPSSQQVLLKVRVAELNRTGFRQIGADLLATIPQFGTLFGTQIAGNGLAGGRVGANTFNTILNGQEVAGDFRGLSLGSQGTVFGTFSRGQFNAVLTALRRNSLLRILAEPNLVALNGHQANFLAGGEFPVPSFSGVGAGAAGGGGTSSTQFKEFGVRLSFLPLVMDQDTIRLTVDPEVSSVDFSIATTLVPGGSPVPGLNVRSSHTTVELKQGETLAIAGLMQLSLDGSTQKVPGLGDLPYIGGFFSNTTSNRIEKELIVLVTPYLIEPMAPGQVPPSPGEEVTQPNDLEFFFLNRIEGRTGVDKRSTTTYDDPFHLIRHSLIERKYLVGPSGYSK